MLRNLTPVKTASGEVRWVKTPEPIEVQLGNMAVDKWATLNTCPNKCVKIMAQLDEFPDKFTKEPNLANKLAQLRIDPMIEGKGKGLKIFYISFWNVNISSLVKMMLKTNFCNTAH